MKPLHYIIPTLIFLGVVTAAAPDIAATQIGKTSGPLSVTGLHVRPTRGKLRVSAAFATITNNTNKPVTLTSAASPIAGKVEIHTTLRDGDIMRMRRLDKGVTIKPGDTVELKPGGLHIMLMKLTGPIKIGQKVTISMTFDNGQTITQTVTAARMAVPRGSAGDTMPRGSSSDQMPSSSHNAPRGSN